MGVVRWCARSPTFDEARDMQPRNEGAPMHALRFDLYSSSSKTSAAYVQTEYMSTQGLVQTRCLLHTSNSLNSFCTFLGGVAGGSKRLI